MGSGREKGPGSVADTLGWEGIVKEGGSMAWGA